MTVVDLKRIAAITKLRHRLIVNFSIQFDDGKIIVRFLELKNAIDNINRLDRASKY